MASGPKAASKPMRVPKIFDAASIAAASGRPFYPCPWCSETIPDMLSAEIQSSWTLKTLVKVTVRLLSLELPAFLAFPLVVQGSGIRKCRQTLLQEGRQPVR